MTVRELIAALIDRAYSLDDGVYVRSLLRDSDKVVFHTMKTDIARVIGKSGDKLCYIDIEGNT